MRERKNLRVILGAVCLVAVALPGVFGGSGGAEGSLLRHRDQDLRGRYNQRDRLDASCRNAAREGKDKPLPVVRYKDPKTGALGDRRGRADLEPVVEFPNGSTIETIEGAVPGAPGDVRVRYNGRRSLMADDGMEGRRSQPRFHRTFSPQGFETGHRV